MISAFGIFLLDILSGLIIFWVDRFVLGSQKETALESLQTYASTRNGRMFWAGSNDRSG